MRISDWSSDVCSSDLDDDKRHFSAIVELRQIAGKTDPLKMPAEYQWRLADNYLGFGMRDRAEEIYRNLAATAPDAKRIGHANLQLAEFDYERGYNAEARATLYRKIGRASCRERECQ